MPFSKQQICDIKDIIVSTISETLSKNEELIQTIARAVVKHIKCDIEVRLKKLESGTKTVSDSNSTLRQKVNLLEQQQKRCNIRIFGLKMEKGQQLNEMVINMMNKNFNQLNLNENDVEYVYQYKSKSTKNKISVLVKLNSYQKKRYIMQLKKKLKGTGIFFMDDLTALNLSIYKKTQEKYGKDKTWTSDGIIFYHDGNSKQKIISLEELEDTDEIDG